MSAKTQDKIATVILYIIASLVVLLLVSFFAVVIYRGASSLNFKFLFGTPKTTAAGGGIGPQLFNSVYMLIISLIITVPFGIGAGIFLAEYAKEGRFVRFVRLSIETMASLPSIVIGLFGFFIAAILGVWLVISIIRSGNI